MNIVKLKIDKFKKAKVTLGSINKWNAGVAILSAIEGVVILVLSNAQSFDVNTNFLTVNPLATQGSGHTVLAEATHRIFDINIVYLIAAFFFISAIIHGLLATFWRNSYESQLKKGQNRFRWLEYGLVASIMLIVLGFIGGVNDISTIVMVIALTAAASILSLVMEAKDQKDKNSNRLIVVVVAIATVIPWVVFIIYILGSIVYGSNQLSTYAYWALASLFVLFGLFAVNTYLQNKKKGLWSDYLHVEQMYMLLLLVAQTALAWQVFAGILRT